MPLTTPTAANLIAKLVEVFTILYTGQMVSSSSISSRSLGLLMPMAFSWAFAGCVLSCSAHGAKALDYHTSISVENFVDESHCEGCPIINSPSCGLPGKQSYLSRQGDATRMAFALFAQPNSEELHSQSWLAVVPPASDPPLERLSVLRI